MSMAEFQSDQIKEHFCYAFMLEVSVWLYCTSDDTAKLKEVAACVIKCLSFQIMISA